MGLILDAACSDCGFAREGLRVGATTAQMSGDRRSAVHLFGCSSCHDVASVELFLGEGTKAACERCGQALERSREFRIVRMSGEWLAGHECPRCSKGSLSFKKTGHFL